MIRMIQSSSSGHAKAYFSDALQKSDYYLNDQELQGRFLGRLGARIGVDGMTTKEDFFALCENINPRTGDRLTQRNVENRRTGYDINFHCPKSVSVLHVLSKDSHIMDAFQASVYETMQDIEADSMTRVRKKGAYDDRPTGELLWADFTHQTARPVDGSMPDPHLHSHCFVFNATWDDVEKEIKAGEFGNIKRDMPYYQARFHKKLSDKLIAQGYNIRLTKKSFEVEGVPQGVIDLFSKRTNEIGEFAKEKGITDVKKLSELGARTRAKKQKGLGMDELKQGWREQVREFNDNNMAEVEQPVRYGKKQEVSQVKANDCIQYATKHSFERASVMPERRLLATAYRHSIGKENVTLDEIETAYQTDAAIIRVQEKGRSVCTTREVLREEKHMVELARAGQGKFRPLYSDVPYFENLNDQQNNAVGHVLTTNHQVSIIKGGAGTGKTNLLKVAVPLIEQTGKKVTMVAPSAEASRGVLKSEGFENADTVARQLLDKNMQAALKDNVLIVDEAGLLGTKEMTSILTICQAQNTRLILLGDTRQHSSVTRGDALRILNTVAGIKSAEISQIYRQRNFHYREVVQNLSKGNVKDAFEKMDGMGSIKTVDPLNANEELVSDYIKAVKKGKSALIVSPTHQQGAAVTQEIRAKLRSSGLIGKKELAATKLNNLNLTEAQKADWRNFEKGQIVQFTQNVPKIKRGSAWVINEVYENGVRMRNKQGEEQLLPQGRANAYNVYYQSEIGLSKGDKIRVTHGGFDLREKRLDNGHALEIVSVNKSGKIQLINKASKTTYALDKEFGHIDHAYCTTSHSSQGKTVDEVFISQPAATFTATDAKQFYVSVSRGRDAATIYTDDKEALLEYAERIGDRQSALELVGKNKTHLDYVQKLERDKYNAKPDKGFEKDNYNLQHPTINKDYEPEF